MATTSRYELDFLEAFRQCESGTITINVLARTIAHRLSELAQWARVTKEEWDATSVEPLVEAFDFLAEDSTATVDELDDILERLYDWADGPVYDENGDVVPATILCRIRSASARHP